MDNQIKETNITIKLRNYNGDYGIGSVFNNEFNVVAKQLANNSNKEKGLIIFTENIGFCCDEKLGSNTLATIKTEIPFSVDYDKLTIFNEMVEKIKTNPDYKYNESHYATDKFDPKSLEYFDIIIDGEEFESNSDEIFKTILHDVIDVEEISGIMDDYYHNLTPIIKRMNKPVYAQPTVQNPNNAEIDKISQIVNEVVGTADMDKNNLLCKLAKKIIDLPFDTETTIAKLMQLDQVLVDPLTQGEVFNLLNSICEKLNIKIEVNHDEIGGLGYHYKFKKKDVLNKTNSILHRSELKAMFSKLTNEIDRNKSDEENIDTIKGFIGVFGLKVKQAETKTDSRFFLYGRMKFLLEELDKNLNENKYIDALFDMSEFLDESRIQPNYEGYDSLIVDKNKEYYSEDIICTEEKDLLMAIVKQFIQKIENRNNDKKMFSQDELKELFYRTMNENEVSKLKELGMDDEIAKLTTSTHQVKYFDGIGYVLIGDGYIIQANGMEQQRYFATIVNSPEEAKQEIIKKLPKQSPTDNNISLEKACEIALNYYKQFGYSSISEIKDTGDKLLIIPQNWERKVGEHLIMIDKVSGKEEQCIMPFVVFEDLVNKSRNVDVPTNYINNNENSNSNDNNSIEYLFEQDENGAFIRLIIPADFVNKIIPSKSDSMDLRGKKNINLTSEEVSVLKIYARELENKKNTLKEIQYTYSYKEYEEMLEKNENGAFIRLVIPENDNCKELNLINKLPQDYTLDDTIRMKQYVKYVHDHILDPNGEKNIDNTINVIVDVIEHLQSGTEISISQILGKNIDNYETNELFEINKCVLKKCEENGIKLDFSKYAGQIVGLPFNIPFIKE